jgi:5-methyltetrahydrofolate--homocysteine methyltransferase
VAQEYKKMREEYYADQKSKTFLTIEKARSKKLKVDWSAQQALVPSFLGVKEFLNFDIASLIEYIDWDPFFQTWQIRGKYPNRTYPKIFNDKTVGEEAKKLFDAANVMLKSFMQEQSIEARGVVAFFKCNQVDTDDIELYSPDNEEQVVGKLHTLRQQQDQDLDTYLAMSDFVAPKGSHKDYIGMFAVSTGFKQEELIAKFELDHDDYSKMLVQTLTDRLAEAFAEKLHVDVRKEHWGYNKEEALANEDLLNVKYQGIRPAPGYPS